MSSRTIQIQEDALADIQQIMARTASAVQDPYSFADKQCNNPLTILAEGKAKIVEMCYTLRLAPDTVLFVARMFDMIYSRIESSHRGDRGMCERVLNHKHMVQRILERDPRWIVA